ncbi:MAG: hypothetical protein AAF441_29285 [Pseudomonadota bacterium]
MKNLVIAVSLLLIGLPAYAQDLPKDLNFEPVATLTGKGKGESGFELVFGKVEIRLNGIAAPDNDDDEGHEGPGGKESAAHLASILADGPMVTCYLNGELAGGEPVAACYIPAKSGGGMEDLARLQVASGHAVDCPRYSGGIYADAEAAAKKAGHDMSAIYKLPAHCIKK